VLMTHSLADRFLLCTMPFDPKISTRCRQTHPHDAQGTMSHRPSYTPQASPGTRRVAAGCAHLVVAVGGLARVGDGANHAVGELEHHQRRVDVACMHTHTHTYISQPPSQPKSYTRGLRTKHRSADP
jgi:hypothetical protein